ncbi:MAG: hypothetical protein OHK005_12910 [Candidatus Methylacidiphilales bacterium]
MSTKPSFRFLVQDIKQIAPDTRLFQFDFGLTPMEYYPGQFVVVTLPQSDPRVTAAITLASSPLRRQSFELAIVRTGNFGTRFYDSVQIGQIIEMSVAQGKFHPELSDPRPILLIAHDYCTTGIRAIWQYHADSSLPRPVTFLHGQRDGQSALFADEFTSTSAPNRRYLPVSLPPAPATLSSETIASALSAQPGCVVFLVGEGPDVAATRHHLEQLGISRDRLHLERWS